MASAIEYPDTSYARRVPPVRGLGINQARPLVMHIDLNSCFSTIEQQANPLIRNKPVAVAAYTSGAGMVLAASYDAKARGIKLGTSVREAKKICPGIVILMPDPPKYREAHRRFREVLLEYTSDVVPKSIDEFVLDFRGSAVVRQGRDLREVGHEIKERIKQHLGCYVTVNVGIGPNRFLAKFAAGLHKPDGLDYIDSHNLVDTLASEPELMALPGINRRYRARLHSAGIATPSDFFARDGKFLQNFVFYSKVGHYWHLRLRGWEVDDREFARRTIGHQYALQQKTTDKLVLKRLLMKLCEKVGRRLRGHDLIAQGIDLHLRYTGFQHWHEGHKTAAPLYATQDIYQAACHLLDGVRLYDAVTLISITVFNLQARDPEQLDLFDTGRIRRTAMARAADTVNDKYGEFTLIPAAMANMEKEIIDRIAFGNVSDL